MNVNDTLGARFATWWAESLTRTADGATALDRRAEIASDVYEQLTEAESREALSAGSRSVMARVVRGMPADVAWRVGLEVRQSRFGWHLRNPSTAITTLLVVMIPLNVAAEANAAEAAASPRYWSLFDYAGPMWAATQLVGGIILLFACLALVSRVSRRWTGDSERFEPQSRLERARRCVTAALGISLAGSAVFRFGALEIAGGACWFAFVACLVVYLALLVVTASVKVLTLGRYLPKVRV